MNDKSLVGTICKVIHNLDWPRKDTDIERPKDYEGVWIPVAGVENIGKLVIVNEEGRPGGKYAVQFLDTGTFTAWYHHECLEYVRDATPDDRVNVDRAAAETEKRNNSFAYQIARIDATGKVDILIAKFIDKKLGYKCAFEHNGEYFSLYQDFMILQPVIRLIITGEDPTANYPDKENIPELIKKVVNLMDEVKSIRQSDEYKNYLAEFK